MALIGFDRSSKEPTEWAVQAAAYEEARRRQSVKAALIVADRASDAADCRELLEMLGLGVDDRRRADPGARDTDRPGGARALW
jgi:hypothetical protein